ncbi:hypothetical protein LDENG_00029000 [Lucifuga dentata]|nr:hypothetical protein LDENG_00029000 [Lucifuga dentata]
MLQSKKCKMPKLHPTPVLLHHHQDHHLYPPKLHHCLQQYLNSDRTPLTDLHHLVLSTDHQSKSNS